MHVRRVIGNIILQPMPCIAPPPPAPPKEKPARRPLPERLLPWVELIGKLLAAIVSALAIWRGLG